LPKSLDIKVIIHKITVEGEIKLMKKLPKIIALVMFFCVCSIVSLSQENKTTHGKDQLDNYLLFMKKSDLNFNQGDEIKVEMILKNASKENIYFIWSSDLEDFSIEVRDENNKTAPLKREVEEAKQFPKTGGRVAIKLQPDEEYEFSLNLSNLYDFTKGNYTLAANRLIYKKDKKGKSLVKLKPAKILIL
jgi:hypothetical protein